MERERNSPQFETESTMSVDRERYVEAKLQRKQADEDAQTLANRIALLKAEEAKALKKIDETRKRAREIMQARQRNAEAQRRKQELAQAKEEEEKIRNYNNRVQKEQIRENQRNVKQTLMDKLKSEVHALKRKKQEDRDAILSQREQTANRNAELHANVINAKRESMERRQQMEAEKQEQALEELRLKIEDEERIRQEREEEIARMEQEELELISRLQNTQSLQKDAYESLENAISGEPTDSPQ